MSADERISAAMKILGPKADRDVVAAVINGLDLGESFRRVGLIEQIERHKRQRDELKGLKPFANRYRAALRRVLQLLDRAPSSLRFAPLQYTVSGPRARRTSHGDAAFREEIEFRILMCDLVKPRQPKRSVVEKLLCARAAVSLCRRYDVATKTTKFGPLWKLAAVLYGNRIADLQKPIRAVLRVTPGELAATEAADN